MSKYQTEKKEQQLKITSNELEIKKLVLRTNLYFFISLFILLSLIISWLIYSNKGNVLKQKLLQDNSNQLLEDFQESSYNSKKIEDQRNDIVPDNETRYKLKDITPRMFRKNEEDMFRARYS